LERNFIAGDLFKEVILKGVKIFVGYSRATSQIFNRRFSSSSGIGGNKLCCLRVISLLTNAPTAARTESAITYGHAGEKKYSMRSKKRGKNLHQIRRVPMEIAKEPPCSHEHLNCEWFTSSFLCQQRLSGENLLGRDRHPIFLAEAC
jgi:hypothetical protein